MANNCCISHKLFITISLTKLLVKLFTGLIIDQTLTNKWNKKHVKTPHIEIRVWNISYTRSLSQKCNYNRLVLQTRPRDPSHCAKAGDVRLTSKKNTRDDRMTIFCSPYTLLEKSRYKRTLLLHFLIELKKTKPDKKNRFIYEFQKIGYFVSIDRCLNKFSAICLSYKET